MPTTIGGGIGVDTRDLKMFVRATRKASLSASKDLQAGLRAAGEIVAQDARSKASQHSKTIAATIKTDVRGATVSVRAGKGDPIASLYELGNKGSGKGTTTFRHPVFGRKSTPWVTQERFPFLRPALDATAPQMEAAILKVADQMANVLCHRLTL